MKQKIKYLIISIALLTISLNVNANGGINISTTDINMLINDKKTFTINATNSAGRIDIVPSNSCINVSQSSAWLDNDSISITVSSTSSCNATININVNAATYDEEELIYTKVIHVVVNEPTTEPITQPVAEPVTTKAQETTTKVTEKSTKKRETTSSTTTTTTTTQTIKENIYLEHLEVDGYDISFDKDNTNYTLEVAYNVKSVNIIAISDNYDITGNIGKVELKSGMNIIEVIVHSKITSEEKKYIIKIKKLQKNTKQINEKTKELSKSSKMLEFFTILLVIEFAIVIGLLLYKLFSKKIEMPKFKN